MKKVARIAVTGGAGQIAYSLLFRLASGELLGKDQPIALHILEIEPAMKALNGVLLELVDCAFPLLQEVVIGSDPIKVFKDVNYAFLVGSQPRKPGMERRDLLEVNGKIFVEQGRALDLVASKDLIALVVGNPCNTNCLIAAAHVKRLGHQHFFAMTTLDENRLKGQLAEKANVLPGDVKRAIVWGNHSATQVPDFFHATIKGKLATEVVVDNEWLKNVMVPRIQKRGAEVLEARGFSSAASAANAALDSMKNLIFPTPKGDFFSMSVYSKDNPYGIDPDLYYSMPCISHGNGEVEVVAGLDIPPYLREKMILSEKELQEERAAVRGMCPFLNQK